MEWRNNLSRDQVAHQLGLDRTYAGTDLVLPVLGIFGAGLLVGVGLGLMLAPKSGQELRGDIRHRATDLQNRTTHAIERKHFNDRAIKENAVVANHHNNAWPGVEVFL